MKIFEAKRRVAIHRILSVIIITISGILFILAILKSVYFAIASDTSVSIGINLAIWHLVQLIYDKTRFLSLLWKLAPVMNLQALNTPGNYGMLFIMLCGTIGRMMWDSASSLSARIEKTIKKVEETEWEQELKRQKGLASIFKPDILQINIDLERKDQWHKRPIGLILIGITIATLGQWINLQFGLVK